MCCRVSYERLRRIRAWTDSMSPRNADFIQTPHPDIAIASSRKWGATMTVARGVKARNEVVAYNARAARGGPMHSLPTIIICLALVMYGVLGFNVGRARSK